MNDENLIPITQRTEKEQREMRKKGGIKSGEVRKKKAEERKSLKLTLDTLLAGDRKVIDGDNGNTRVGICIAILQKALNGDISAFNTIRDTIGEKPVDNVINNIVSQVNIKKADIQEALNDINEMQ